MKRIVVAVMEDAPSYWSVLFDDGSSELLDASNYNDAQDEADRKFGALSTIEHESVDDEQE